MIEIDIPGFGPLKLENLVLDYNGTLAVDGVLIGGVGERLSVLSKKLTVYVITADTFGNAREGLKGIPCELVILPAGSQDVAKTDFVTKLDPVTVVAIGNGRNDHLMLGKAALGIAVILGEGAAIETLEAADVATTSITAALDLLISPKRLIATLRW